MNCEKIVKSVYEPAKKVELGPGVEMRIKLTQDRMGYEIKIEGSFMHGGIEIEEMIQEFKDFFKKVDGSF